MRKLRKVMALLLTLAMVMGMSLTTFAANAREQITVNGLANTGTNSVSYVKILEPNVKAPGGYQFADGVTIEGYDTAKDFMNASVDQQKTALLNEETVLPTGTTGEVTGNTSFSATVDAGYYAVYITNTAGQDDPVITYNNPMIVSVEYENAKLNVEDGTYTYDVKKDDSDHSVTAKYTSIPVTKKGEDKNEKDETVEIGQKATYTIETFIPSEVTTFTLTDILTGATYDQDSVVVKIEGNNTNIASSTVTFPLTKLEDMLITLDDYLTDNAGKRVTITYDVTVTGTKVGNTVTPNDNKHEYTPAQEELYTGGVQLTKYSDNGTTPMQGAKFVLYKNVKETGESEPTAYYAVVDNNGNLINWTTNKSDATQLTTNNNGVITVDGLDLDTYYFEEVEAPEGYSINPEIKDVIVSEENTNKKDPYNRAATTMNDTELASLPSTGGIGTTIFTIGGCVIMIAAAGLYFASRRKHGEN